MYSLPFFVCRLVTLVTWPYVYSNGICDFVIDHAVGNFLVSSLAGRLDVSDFFVLQSLHG